MTNAARIAAFTVAAGVATGAFASAQRTFVASDGDDVHPCSFAQPCRSFTAAVANTAAGGEVIVLDSAGYGPVTITQSVSIIAPAGIYAGISAPSGAGITINGSNIVVALRGLTITGHGGFNGIDFVSGAKLVVEDCDVARFTAGINAAAASSKVIVRNTTLRDNRPGAGFDAAAALDATLDHMRVIGNANGVISENGARVTVADSFVANNDTSGVFVQAPSGVAEATVARTTLSGNQTGLEVYAVSAGTARILSDTNVINEMAAQAFLFGPGNGTQTIYTTGDNSVGFGAGVVTGGALTGPCCRY